MANTTIVSGTFVSTGAPAIIPIRCGIDWFKVYNYTKAGTGGTRTGFEYIWMLGMNAGTGIVKYVNTAASPQPVNVDTLQVGGFTLLDTSVYSVSGEYSGSTLTQANPMVGTIPTIVNPFLVGDVAEIYSIDANLLPIQGMQFTVTAVTAGAGGNITLGYMDSSQANFTGGSAASFKVRKVPFQPQFYPRRRNIVKMIPSGTGASGAYPAVASGTTLVQMSVVHQFTVGQEIRLNIPSDYGSMSDLDRVKATIISVSTTSGAGALANYIVVDVDSSSLVWSWPASTTKLTFAQVVPVGENSPYVQNNIIVNPQNPIADATVNRAILGMLLGTGGIGVNNSSAITGPAGSLNDVVYWEAGVNFSANLTIPLAASSL